MTTKELIIKGARNVFEKFGFHKASMEDIALAARKGRRTIYSHFQNKEEVFKAVLDKEVSALASKLQAITRQAIPPDQKLKVYMHTRMNAIKEMTIYYDALRQDLVNNMGIVESLRKSYDKQDAGLIRYILDEGNNQGVFAIEDTALVSKAIVLATKGFELPIFLNEQDYDHKQLIDPLINLLYEGIKKKNSQTG